MSYPPPPPPHIHAPPGGQTPEYPPQMPGYPPGPQQPAFAAPGYVGQGYNSMESREVYRPTGNDSEADNEFAASPFSDKAIRRQFIGKVYAIMGVQLLVTAAMVAVFIFVPPVRAWVKEHVWFYYLAYAVFFVTYIVLACCRNVCRRFPGNFIALGVFTVALAYMAGTLSAMYTVNSVLVCLLITLGVCVSVSIAAMCCPCDLTKCQAVIGFLSVLFFIFGIAVMITYFAGGYNHYLAFDTQMIMGDRKHQLSPEEYIYGAMQLYLDVINLFMIFLSLFGVASND